MILINRIICITGQASSEQRHEFCSVTGRLTFSNVCYFILLCYGDILGYPRGVSTYHGLITSKETLRLLNLFVRQIII